MRAANPDRLLHFFLGIAAVLLGVGIAYVDSRPGWDDTGVTALVMLASAGVISLIAPRRAWLWALCVGIWIPLLAAARTHSLGALMMLVVLAFPFAGAYAAVAARKILIPRP